MVSAPDLTTGDRIYFKDNGYVITYHGTIDGKYFRFVGHDGDVSLKTEAEVNHILHACRVNTYDANGHNLRKTMHV